MLKPTCGSRIEIIVPREYLVANFVGRWEAPDDQGLRTDWCNVTLTGNLRSLIATTGLAMPTNRLTAEVACLGILLKVTNQVASK